MHTSLYHPNPQDTRLNLQHIRVLGAFGMVTRGTALLDSFLMPYAIKSETKGDWIRYISVEWRYQIFHILCIQKIRPMLKI